MKLLLLYTTREGQTAKIMHYIRDQLGAEIECDCVNLLEQPDIDLQHYQAALLATSIRYGYYHPVMRQFVEQHLDELNQMLSGFIGVNLVARKANKNSAETNLYTKKYLQKTAWQPQFKAVVAGALYYPRYSWFDRNMIRFIMWLGKGETDITKEKIEYTDWQQVAKIAQQFKQLLLEQA